MRRNFPTSYKSKQSEIRDRYTERKSHSLPLLQQNEGKWLQRGAILKGLLNILGKFFFSECGRVRWPIINQDTWIFGPKALFFLIETEQQQIYVSVCFCLRLCLCYLEKKYYNTAFQTVTNNTSSSMMIGQFLPFGGVFGVSQVLKKYKIKISELWRCWLVYFWNLDRARLAVSPLLFIYRQEIDLLISLSEIKQSGIFP